MKRELSIAEKINTLADLLGVTSGRTLSVMLDDMTLAVQVGQHDRESLQRERDMLARIVREFEE